MGLILKLKNALVEQSCLPNTVATYCHWARKFYAFTGKPASTWTLRHAFATHAMQAGNDPKTVQDLLGHESLVTTMIYLHGDAARGVSPLDAGARPAATLQTIGGFLA